MDTIPEPRRGVANYRGDVRNSDYIAGLRANNRVMRAAMVEYDPETDMTRVHFEETADPEWVMALHQEEWALRNLHAMYPAFFVAPR